MADDAAGTRFTTLDTAESIDENRLPEFYAYPDDLRGCWVRGNMIASLDGGATADGKSGGLGGPGDRAIFGLMRHLADVVLVGAGTVRAENYSGAQFSPAERQARQHRGQAEVPPIAVLTNSASLDHDAKLFTHTDVPPLILTCADSTAEATGRLGSVAEVVDASGPRSDRVDMAAALTALAERGLVRVLVEGGPAILGELIEHNLLDELCMTIAPLLVGGKAGRIATGPGQVRTPLQRRHLLADEQGYLYTRYVKSR
jgi:riboflavin biosynthesis pyrimidine reductase